MMDKVKCEHCGKTLFLAESAKLEIKCPRCGRINKIEIEAKSVKHEGQKP